MDLSRLLQKSFYYIRYNEVESLPQNIDKKTKMIKNYFDKQIELSYFEMNELGIASPTTNIVIQ